MEQINPEGISAGNTKGSKIPLKKRNIEKISFYKDMAQVVSSGEQKQPGKQREIIC